MCVNEWEDLNFGGDPFFSAQRSVRGHVKRRLRRFCLYLSIGIDESRAVLLPVLLPFYDGTILVARVCG